MSDKATSTIVEAKPKTMKHRLRPGVGLHIANDAVGKERVYKPGDVVESSSDLSQRWPEKFERVFDDVPVSKGENSPGAGESNTSAPITPNNSVDTFDAMTLDELRKFAAEEEIDIRSAKTKAEAIKLIKAAIA